MVSVIIPCYNGMATIGGLVRSVREQEAWGAEDEIIVVDDHSTDETCAIARQAGARVVQTPVNSGPSVARNLGVATAAHSILFFLDADTMLEPGALAVVKKHFAQTNPAPCLNGYCSPEPITRSFARDYKGMVEYSWYLQSLDSQRAISCFNTRVGAMTRQAFESSGGFDGRFRKASVEDYEFSYRLIRHHAIVLAAGLAVRHDHPGFVETTKAYWTRTQQWLALFRERRQFDNGGTSSGNAAGHLLGAVAVVSTLLPVWHGQLVGVPILLLGLFVGSYRQFFGLAWQRRGVGFFLGCLGLHLYYSMVIAVAATVALLGGGRS